MSITATISDAYERGRLHGRLKEYCGADCPFDRAAYPDQHWDWFRGFSAGRVQERIDSRPPELRD